MESLLLNPQYFIFSLGEFCVLGVVVSGKKEQLLCQAKMLPLSFSPHHSVYYRIHSERMPDP